MSTVCLAVRSSDFGLACFSSRLPLTSVWCRTVETLRNGRICQSMAGFWGCLRFVSQMSRRILKMTVLN
ncbi:MAG: hypothetical protein JWP89_5656 [Schlesneria sp.]|nr:hypothetical protein [Schlesneria sp.]